jgi:serine protease Do
MRRGEIPLYLLAIFVVAWWNFSGDEGELRTPRYTPPSAPPSAGQSRAEPGHKNLPEPNFRDPVVRIENSGPVHNATGTAFAVDESGLWITARHVVDSCNRLGFVDPSGRTTRRSGPVWLHPNSDMALVQGPKAGAAVQLTDKPPKIGADAFHIGYPQGKPGDVLSTVMGRARMVTRGRYRIDEPIVAYAERARYPAFSGTLGGISGGPIFNGDGEVIGVSVAESPRRGRVMGTAPRSFEPLFAHAGKRPQAKDITTPTMAPASLANTGDAMRRGFVVARLLCYAS